METKEIKEWIKTKGKVEIAGCPRINPACKCPFYEYMNSVCCYDIAHECDADDVMYNYVTHICNMKSVLASEAETQAVIADKELMVQIGESRKDCAEGKSRNVEDLFKELGI